MSATVLNGEHVSFARDTGWLCGCRDFEETRKCEHIVLASCWVLVRRAEVEAGVREVAQ